MRRLRTLITTMALAAAPALTAASDAQTSATAGSSRYNRNGAAQASARYDGDFGFARTDTRSGSTSSARGVAVGVDESGLSLSVSNAFASRGGPAVATTYNISIGRDGRVSRSGGMSVADGPIHRSAAAGGSVGTGRHGRNATAYASGRTGRHGRVQARTDSNQGLRRVAPWRAAPPEMTRSVKKVKIVRRTVTARTSRR